MQPIISDTERNPTKDLRNWAHDSLHAMLEVEYQLKMIRAGVKGEVTPELKEARRRLTALLHQDEAVLDRDRGADEVPAALEWHPTSARWRTCPECGTGAAFFTAFVTRTTGVPRGYVNRWKCEAGHEWETP